MVEGACDHGQARPGLLVERPESQIVAVEVVQHGLHCAQELFARAVQTMLHNLDRYDLGFWSLYEQSGTRLPMVASPFYHQLHIAQLRIMYRLTGEAAFTRMADRCEGYARSPINRIRALAYKSAFKLCYY